MSTTQHNTTQQKQSQLITEALDTFEYFKRCLDPQEPEARRLLGRAFFDLAEIIPRNDTFRKMVSYAVDSVQNPSIGRSSDATLGFFVLQNKVKSLDWLGEEKIAECLELITAAKS